MFNYNAAKQAGYTDEQIGAYMRMKGVKAPQTKSVGGFMGNIVGSGFKAVGDLGGALVNTLNPDMEKNTVANLGKLVIGTLQYIDPTQALGTKYEKNAKAVGQFYLDRYGSVDKVMNTLYNDPVGMALDVGAVLSGAGGALKGAGSVSKVAGLTKAGNAFSKAASFTDPFSLAGKGVRVAGKPVAGAIRPALKDVSTFLARRSIKASGSQANKFAEMNRGLPVEKFLLENNITGGATKAGMKQLDAIISPLQKLYDKQTKTGAVIDRKIYAQALLDKAIELEKMSDDPATRSLVEKLFKEAEYQNSKLSPMTNTQLADTKTKAFKNSADNALANPNVSSLNEQIGRAGQGAIEIIAPGSKKLGQKLKPYYGLKEIMSAQSEVGRGAQIVNGFKAPFAGMIAGAGAGSFLPGVGNLGGAIAGSIGAYVANSPRFQGSAAVALNKLSKGKFPKVPGKVVNTAKTGYDLARAGRVINSTRSYSPTTSQQTNQPTAQVQKQSTIVSPSYSPTYSNKKQIKSPQAFGGNVKLQRGSFY